ncbi:MAG: peptidylprolyl isomerase [Actinomycetota bacterium]|nr:peptidylprolyl isomerase [Actinomycetota bacterium]
MKPSRILAPLALLALVAACGDDSTDTTSSTDTPAAAECAPADGSAARTTAFAAAPPMCLVEGKAYVAIIETNQATLRVDLRADIAPNTVNSFVNLARYHYFDGTTCHRAIQNFVVQCGDPTATGKGGPGYRFADELDQVEPYRIGSLAMANSGPDTQGSQWFIITGDDGAMLPAKYTLFGQVEDNDLGNVLLLDSLANPQDGPPLQPIDIISITIEEV